MLPALRRAGQGRAGGAFPAGVFRAAVAAPAPLRQQLVAGSRFPWGGDWGLAQSCYLFAVLGLG